MSKSSVLVYRFPLQHKMTANPTQLRSLYRSFLRELPRRTLTNSSPLQRRIRGAFCSVSGTDPRSQIEEAEQHVQYLKAQRMYVTLLERYNPGMSMDETDKVRLTARRVGMDLPEEWRPGQKSWVSWNFLACSGLPWANIIEKPSSVSMHSKIHHFLGW